MIFLMGLALTLIALSVDSYMYWSKRVRKGTYDRYAPKLRALIIIGCLMAVTNVGIVVVPHVLKVFP